MRVAVFGILHESNSYSTVPASLDQWESAGVLLGNEISDHYGDADHVVSGFLELPTVEINIELVPLMFTQLVPMGPITAEAFESLISRGIDLIQEHGPWDVLLVANHGAAVSDEYPDADGEMLRRLREAVGPDVVIATCLDMHANLSQLQISSVDVMTVYQTNPHIDARTRALEAARLAVRAARGEIRPTMSLVSPPLTIDILSQGTDDDGMRGLLDEAASLRSLPHVLSLSVAEGYPYADVEHMGMSFLAVTDSDSPLADELAQRMATMAWHRRAGFVGTALSADDALQAAAAEPEGPVLLLDTGDNVGAGSPADSTYLLSAAQRLGIRSVFNALYDPASVLACIKSGIGTTVTLEVGGKTDTLHGEPVIVTGKVRLLFDGRWEDAGPTHGGTRFFDAGPSALIETDDGHHLVLMSVRLGTVSRELLTTVGLDPRSFQIIIAKGTNSPRASFEPITSRMIFVGTPGVSSADLSTFEYRHRRRPMFPFERDAAYTPQHELSL